MDRKHNCRVIGATNHYSIEPEIEAGGFDRADTCEIISRARGDVLKLESLVSESATHLGRMIEEFGGIASIGKGSGERVAMILAGSPGVYKGLDSRLRSLGGELVALADEITATLEGFYRRNFTLRLRPYELQLGERTHVMGILNITPDSFSDGGLYLEAGKAVEAALKMVEDGADIIDVGGESSRPGSDPISSEDEWKRVEPVLVRLLDQVDLPISIDTYKSEVAERALRLGVHLVNDISGLRGDDRMGETVAGYKVAVVLMHLRGTPKTMQLNPEYESLVSGIMDHLGGSISLALEAGVEGDKIIIDPGIGFGKTVVDNLVLLRRLREFASLGCPILIGTSRKSFIGKILRNQRIRDLPVEERVEGSAATVVAAVMAGAHLVRVHDVKEMVRVCRMADAIKTAGANLPSFEK